MHYESGTQMLRDINTRCSDVSGIDPTVVIAGLLNARPSIGLGPVGRATPQTVARSFKAYQLTALDHATSPWDRGFLESLGLDLRVGADEETIYTFHYEDAYGEGLAESVISHIRGTSGDARWQTEHLAASAGLPSRTSVLVAAGLVAALIVLALLV